MKQLFSAHDSVSFDSGVVGTAIYSTAAATEIAQILFHMKIAWNKPTWRS
jgi:hypothetical protein